MIRFFSLPPAILLLHACGPRPGDYTIDSLSVEAPGVGCDRLEEDGSEFLGDSLSLDRDSISWGPLESGTNGFCSPRPYRDGFDCSYAMPNAENWELEVIVTPETQRRELGGGIFVSLPSGEGSRCQATASFNATLE